MSPAPPSPAATALGNVHSSPGRLQLSFPRRSPPSTPPRSPERGWHPLEHAVAAEALRAALAPFEIFLSYRRSRSGDARALKMALVELGHRVFFDVDRDEGLGAGDVQAQLEAVLAETSVLLALVTPAPSGNPGDWREGLSSMETVRACPGWLSEVEA
jgi:hypothetical protein